MAPVRPVILDAHIIAAAPLEYFPDEQVGGTVHWKTLLSAPATPTNTFTTGIATCVGTASYFPSSSVSSSNPQSPSTTTLPSTYTPPCASASSSTGHLKLHRHTHPELYYIISGAGIVTIDDVDYTVKEGSVVFIPGDAEHGVRSTTGEDLKWLYVFNAAGFGEVAYRFSDGKDEAKRGVKAKI